MLNDAVLVRLLKQAYSGEKAAAFAYQGHAGSVKSIEDKTAIRQIELDEWTHRNEVLQIMKQYQVPVSRWYEMKCFFIGKTISAGCYLIGWFMPFYFAGDLESGNVCEYVRMKRLLNNLGIVSHDEILYEMSLKEKEHEIYFYRKIEGNKWLPFFEKIFHWGSKSKNDVDLDEGFNVSNTNAHCKYYGEGNEHSLLD